MSGSQSSRRMRYAMKAALLALALLPATAASQTGTLFIVGGGPQPESLVREFVALAGGSEARIIVFAMASVNGERSGRQKAEQLHALGVRALNVWVTREEASSDSVARLLDVATGIWFGGGDQNRLAAALRGTATERAIHARYAAGAVIGGTSAGAAVMSALMITGDELHPGALRPDSTLAWGTIARGNVEVDPGFALIGSAVIDQHFLRRRRHNRLVSLVLEREPHLGVGIDESTALIVGSDGMWSVRGASVAVVYDARSATMTDAAAPALGATGVRMHVLPAGSTFDPRTGVATLHPEVTP